MKESEKIQEMIQDLLKGKDTKEREVFLRDAYYNNSELFKLLVYGFCGVLVKKHTYFKEEDLEECRSETYLYVLNKLSEKGREYNKTKGTFLTFIYYYIRNGISSFIYNQNKFKKHETCVEDFKVVCGRRISKENLIFFDKDFGENIKGLIKDTTVEKIKENMKQELRNGNVDNKEYTALECAYLWKIFRQGKYSTI